MQPDYYQDAAGTWTPEVAHVAIDDLIWNASGGVRLRTPAKVQPPVDWGESGSQNGWEPPKWLVVPKEINPYGRNGGQYETIGREAKGGFLGTGLFAGDQPHPLVGIPPVVKVKVEGHEPGQPEHSQWRDNFNKWANWPVDQVFGTNFLRDPNDSNLPTKGLFGGLIEGAASGLQMYLLMQMMSGGNRSGGGNQQMMMMMLLLGKGGTK